MTEQIHRQEGMRDNVTGLPRNLNPHMPETAEWFAWDAGWQAAEDFKYMAQFLRQIQG